MAEKAYYTYDAITSLPDTAVIPCCINPGTVPVSKTITGSSLRTSIQAFRVLPSGDETGATDAAAINAALSASDVVVLDPGDYYINATIDLNASEKALIGSGRSTKIRATANDFACITLSGNAQQCTVRDLYTLNGLYSLDINNASRSVIDNCYFGYATSHGVYIHAASIILDITNCWITNAGGAGIHSVSTATDANGNALNVQGTTIESCGANGIHYSAAGCNINGCCIESNTGAGVKISCETSSALAIDIRGCYFEGNTVACVELHSYVTYAIEGVCIDGNRMSTPNDKPAVYAHGEAGRIRQLDVGVSNSISGATTVKALQVSTALVTSRLHVARASHDMDTGYLARSKITNVYSREVLTEAFSVACNADKTGATPTIITLPAGSTIHEITAKCTQAMNGSGTKTFEVGVAGNADKYIDSADFNPATLNDWQAMTGGGANDQATTEILAADTAIIATWTNTGGTPNAGSVLVKVTYSTETYYTNTVAVPA